jgi:hypothetical protein
LIYPEIIFGNPLGAKNVVRYMRNKEGALKSWGMNAASALDSYIYLKDYFIQINSSETYEQLNYPEKCFEK